MGGRGGEEVGLWSEGMRESGWLGRVGWGRRPTQDAAGFGVRECLGLLGFVF